MSAVKSELCFWFICLSELKKKIFLENERNSQRKSKGKRSQLCSRSPPGGGQDICLFAIIICDYYLLESRFGTGF